MKNLLRYKPVRVAVAVVGAGLALAQAKAFAVAPGDLDPAFGGAGYVQIAFDLGDGNYDTPQTLIVDSQNRIVVGGYASSPAATIEMVIARLLENGDPDPAYIAAGTGKWHGAGPAGQPALGTALVERYGIPCLVGFIYEPSLATSGHIECPAEFNQAASRTTAIAGKSVEWIAAAPRTGSDSEFYVAGAITNAGNREAVLERFLIQNGSIIPDMSFGANSDGLVDGFPGTIAAMAVSEDGVFVVGSGDAGGLPTNRDFVLSIVLHDGTPLVTFSHGFDIVGSNHDDRATTIAFGLEQVWIAGTVSKNASGSDRDVGVITSDDTGGAVSFSESNPTLDESVNGIAIDSFGRAYVVGSLSNATNTESSLAVMRLTPEGVIDTAWGSNGRRIFTEFGAHSGAVAVAIQNDQPVVLGSMRKPNSMDTDFVVLRLIGDVAGPEEIFRDGFETP